jgi:hypothetical protein
MARADIVNGEKSGIAGSGMRRNAIERRAANIAVGVIGGGSSLNISAASRQQTLAWRRRVTPSRRISKDAQPTLASNRIDGALKRRRAAALLYQTTNNQRPLWRQHGWRHQHGVTSAALALASHSAQRGAARAHRGARAYQQTWRLLALAGARAAFPPPCSGGIGNGIGISGVMAKSINKRIEENINVVAAWRQQPRRNQSIVTAASAMKIMA